MPRRTGPPLVGITLAVLAAHALVLRGLLQGAHWQPGAPPPAPVLIEALLTAPPAPLPEAKPATAEATPTPPPRPAPSAALRAQPPAPDPAPSPEPAPAESPAAVAPTAVMPPTDAAAEPPSVSASAAAAPPTMPAATASASPQAAATPDAEGEESGAESADIPLNAGVWMRTPGGAEEVAAPGMATRVPAPARLAFDVQGQARRLQYSARAELLWQHDGQRYTARQQISAFLLGSRIQQSTGRIGPEGLQPERFADRRRSEQAAHFDSTQGRVTFSANTPALQVGAGAQDRLSVFLQLGAWIAADPTRFAPGTQITLTTVSARAADRWTFTVEGEETLQVGGSPLPALRLQRLPRKEYDQKAELWLAPSLGYLPVRIRLTQANGDFADLLLRSHSTP